MTQVLDRLIDAYLAPVLMAQGFRRNRRRFQLERADSVAELQVKLDRRAPRFTFAAGVVFRDWARALTAERSLRRPLDFYDRHVSAIDDSSPYPGAEKWWVVAEDGDGERSGPEAAHALTFKLLPTLYAAMSPEGDRDLLLTHFESLRRDRAVLGRLYFWLVTLGPRDRAAAVRTALVESGGANFVARVENFVNAHAQGEEP